MEDGLAKIENGKSVRTKSKEVKKQRTFTELRSEFGASSTKIEFLKEATMQECWTLLINRLLTRELQLEVYNIHHQALFESCKGKFKHLYLYCAYYQDLVSDSIKDLFIKKLKSPRNIHMLDLALSEMKFLRKQKEELLSIKMYHKFASNI